MEQHNIDSRFKNSLGNLERQPSADAWARLQSKMAETAPTPVVVAEEPAEKKRTAWWLSIAAAVVLLLASVAVFRGLPETNQNQPKLASASKRVIPSEKAKPETSQKIIAPEKMEIAMVPASKNNVPESVKTGSETTRTLKTEAAKTKLPATAKQTSEPVITHTKKTVAPAAGQIKTVASGQEKPETQLAYQAPEKAVANPEPASELAGKPIEVIVKFEKKGSDENTAVAAAAPEDHSAKKPLLNSLFKQAKSLKNGEGVNLAEISLIQDAKLAIGNRNLPARFSKVFQN